MGGREISMWCAGMNTVLRKKKIVLYKKEMNNEKTDRRNEKGGGGVGGHICVSRYGDKQGRACESRKKRMA